MLDDIVGRVVHDHLDNLDLSGITRIRVDETSAKKRHRYITVVTDVDTGEIVLITKGKDSKTMEEFACWLSAHGGNPKDIVLMASDFGDSFIKGAREHLPNARNVYDPFQCDRRRTNEGLSERTSPSVWGDPIPTCVG
jgi:transposase